MTRYTVTWLQGAQDHLASLWMQRPDRKRITQAANAVDQELAADPMSKGQPASEGLRTLHVPPLHVLFSVREPDRMVEVASVRADPHQENGEDLGSSV